MMKKTFLALPLCLMSAACVHEPKAIAYTPPSVTYSVAYETDIPEADQKASNYCYQYHKSAVRQSATPMNGAISVDYVCE